jgi:hypothetical protein
MRRTVSLLLAGLALALPSAALAQSAGDDQYADPFGQVNDGGGQSQQAQQPTDSTPTAPAQTTVQATPADQATASQDTTGGTLPRTGLDAILFAVMGAALLLAGTTVRRLVS